MSKPTQAQRRESAEAIIEGKYPTYHFGWTPVSRYRDMAVSAEMENGVLREELARERQIGDNCRADASLKAAELNALYTTIVSEVGGKVEGHPTSRLNYLQRIRELRAREIERDELRKAHFSGGFPDECYLCGKVIESADDLDWHGLGNCVVMCERCDGTGIEPDVTPAGRAAQGE